MMTRPKRKKRERMGVERLEKPRSIPGYLKWVRGCVCCIPGCGQGPIEAAHIRAGVPNEDKGGMGLKSRDKWAVPLCAAHHREQHQVGEITFWQSRNIDPIATARRYWNAWPGRIKWEKEHEAPK